MPKITIIIDLDKNSTVSIPSEPHSEQVDSVTVETEGASQVLTPTFTTPKE